MDDVLGGIYLAPPEHFSSLDLSEVVVYKLGTGEKGSRGLRVRGVPCAALQL